MLPQAREVVSPWKVYSRGCLVREKSHTVIQPVWHVGGMLHYTHTCIHVHVHVYDCIHVSVM